MSACTACLFIYLFFVCLFGCSRDFFFSENHIAPLKTKRLTTATVILYHKRAGLPGLQHDGLGVFVSPPLFSFLGSLNDSIRLCRLYFHLKVVVVEKVAWDKGKSKRLTTATVILYHKRAGLPGLQHDGLGVFVSPPLFSFLGSLNDSIRLCRLYFHLKVVVVEKVAWDKGKSKRNSTLLRGSR